MESPRPDIRIQEIAARQHGVISRSQLLGAGVGPGAIRHRLWKGTLQRIHRGVYRTGPVTARYQPEMAALLACGPGAVLSHHTAAGLWGLTGPRQREAPVDVSGPRSLRGPRSGVRLRRRGVIPPDEVAEVHGLTLTSPARTLLDLAPLLDPSDLERAVARALRQEIVDRASLEAVVRRHSGRRGCRRLASLLEAADGPAFTRSQAEAGFLALLRRGDVQRPRVNAVVAGLEVDFLWPEQRVVVEVDGFAFHSRRSRFENDRRRDALLAAEGHVVIRITWRQLQQEPERVLTRLCLALGARTRTPRQGREIPERPPRRRG